MAQLTGGPGAPLETAAAHASRAVPVAAVDAVLQGMRGGSFDSAAVVAVCDGHRLIGLATIERLLAAPASATVDEVMDADPPTVRPGSDQERAAWLAVGHHEPGLAVVDEAGRFHGLIPPHRLLAVLLEEHDEDMARLGGYLRSTAAARQASVESVRRRLWHRLPWLVLGLVGATLSAGLMGGFEHQLEANLLIALFVPGIVYLADAVGTQTEAVAIRGLSIGVGIRWMFAREVLTGLFVGILLGGMMLPIVALLWGDAAVAATVAIAIVTASAIATVVAMVLYFATATTLVFSADGCD
jgi:magnesium transporter